MSDAAKAASKRIRLWRENPVQFVRDEFKVEPDPWQVDVLMEFARSQRIAMKACKGPGKTCVIAWCAWNFLATRPHPKIAATSISGDNLADGLWTEMAKWQIKSAFLTAAFEWKKTRIESRHHPETWWMSARSWSQSADSTKQADTLAGLHAEYLLFIIDEVGGVPDSVMAAAEAGLSTGTEVKLLIAGNPTQTKGPLYRACTTERALWKVIEITGDPNDPKRSTRISLKWANEQIQKYGRENPWVLVNVFGRFPPSSLNSLIGPDEVTAAMNRHLTLDQYSFAAKILGVDIARQGDDASVIFPRQGLAAFRPKMFRNEDSQNMAGHVAAAEDKWLADGCLVDGTGGYGSGVIDAMRKMGRTPLEVQFAGKPFNPKYVNKRAEMWFLMVEWIKAGGALPNIPELVGELTVPTYTFQGDKFLMQPKEQIKEILGRSPDYADALACTFAFPIAPTNRDIHPSLNKRGHVSENDPYEGM
jgi:phage terminase large subunit